MTTPLAYAAKGFMLSLFGVAVFLAVDGWAGAFVASLVVVALATGGAWLTSR